MRIVAYLHGNKERLYELGQESGLKGEALHRFTYALYEVKCVLEVNPETGESVLVEASEA